MYTTVEILSFKNPQNQEGRGKEEEEEDAIPPPPPPFSSSCFMGQ